MPRYVFDVLCDTHQRDDVGIELPDISASRVHAIALVGRLLNRTASDLWSGDYWVIEVRDHVGLTLFSLGFSVSETPIAQIKARPD